MTGVEVGTVAPEEDRLLLAVLERGSEIDVEVIERIVALKERAEDRDARRQLADAIADFQAVVPEIRKTKSVDYVGRSGVGVSYTYAPLDVIAKTIRQHLHASGLSYTWDSRTEPGAVHCSCTLRHVAGAEISASFGAPIDDAAKMSGPQKTAAALTYARRQSLIQVLGLTTTDDDSDAEEQLTGETISDEQLRELQLYASEGGADLKRFVAMFDIESLDQLDATRFEEALLLLKKKVGSKPKKKARAK